MSNLTTSTQILSEMRQQQHRIGEMDTDECLDYLDGLYGHDLDHNSPLHKLHAEARDQCRRDYESALTREEKADWDWIKALPKSLPR